MSAYRWDAVIDEGMAEPPFLAENGPRDEARKRGVSRTASSGGFPHPRWASRIIDFSGISSIYPACVVHLFCVI